MVDGRTELTPVPCETDDSSDSESEGEPSSLSSERDTGRLRAGWTTPVPPTTAMVETDSGVGRYLLFDGAVESGMATFDVAPIDACDVIALTTLVRVCMRLPMPLLT